MLKIKNLYKSFGDFQAVKNLSLSVGEGEIYCLLGANGAGKSTTINLCLGFILADSGDIEIGGLSVRDEPLTSKRYVAYIPENLMLYPRLTGLENLDYFCGLAGKRYSKTQLVDFLIEAGLDADFIKKRVCTYSKGMRQKVGIALAVAKEAQVLFLDEPTSGLDPVAGHEFASLLNQLSQEGRSIFMATHDLFRARETGTRIGIMRSGELVDEFSASTIDHGDLEKLYIDHMSHPKNAILS